MDLACQKRRRRKRRTRRKCWSKTGVEFGSTDEAMTNIFEMQYSPFVQLVRKQREGFHDQRVSCRRKWREFAFRALEGEALVNLEIPLPEGKMRNKILVFHVSSNNFGFSVFSVLCSFSFRFALKK